MGGQCACAIGDYCGACGLVAASGQGSVVRGICLGHAAYAALCCLCGGSWGLFDGGSFPQSVTRRLSRGVVVVRFIC